MRDTSTTQHVDPPASPRVLVVDDEEDFREVLASLLERLGLQVTTASSGTEGLDIAASTSFDTILLDQRMPGLSGLEVAARLRAAGIATPIVVVSAAHDIATIARTMGTPLWLRKPFGLTALQQVLGSAGVPTRDPAGS